MAFDITSCRVYPLEVEEPLRKTFPHVCELAVTAANSDTSLDLATASASDSDAAALKTFLSRIDAFFAPAYVPGLVAVDGSNQIIKYDSAASAGGGATETLTVTGVLAADEILAVTQRTKGANSVALVAWTDTGRSNNQLAVEWTGNPGAGAVLRVLTRKAAAQAAPQAGQFIWNASTLSAPTLTFVGGTSTPTAFKIYLLGRIKPNMAPIYYAPDVLT